MINKLIRWTGFMIVRRAPSSKMMIEHANTSESFHPSRGGRTVDWMRYIARQMGEDRG